MTPIYDALVKKNRGRDPFRKDRTLLAKYSKYNKDRESLRKVADEHYGQG